MPRTIMDSSQIALLIQIKGLVQGVGFRPFIYRIAHQCDIKGWVENRNDGVKIKAEGTQNNIDNFLQLIFSEAPIASSIDSMEANPSLIECFRDFTIKKSENSSNEITEVSPDIAVCDNCLADMKVQKHRLDYPFINCTNCGPRFSIIRDLPYDRDKTTMDIFQKCDQCESEYTDVLDRRFHAQPVACNQCGPQYELHFENKIISSIEAIISKTVSLIDAGKIVAIKAAGGFHLAVDALNDDAVKQLRQRKHRENKPFAVMFRSVDNMQPFVEINKVEEILLASWRRPIVLLKEKSGNRLSPEVSIGLRTLGCFLPYLPIHYLLFEKLKTNAIVLTSGNISDEPILIDNNEALEKLQGIADAFLIYNRDIYNRTDDSVATVINGKQRIIRRSRGFAPNPVALDFSVDSIFASGGELKNTFCIGKGNQAILSQHIGDLKNLETLEFYEESVCRFQKLFRVNPATYVCDLHPDYLSSAFVEKFSKNPIRVQHHHAHIASCMAEHGLNEKVIGICFDGTGFGTDNNIWGSEFFIADFAEFKRVSHFEYIPLPGGDKAVHEPWRILVSYLYHYFGKEELYILYHKYFNHIPEEKLNLTITAIEKKLNTPFCCSAGRLFDAVAALISNILYAGFEAEGPMRMESIIDWHEKNTYSYKISEIVSFKKTFIEIIEDLNQNIAVSIIAAKFHNTIIYIINDLAVKMRDVYGINKVVLSGGVFQNRYLLENIENMLHAGRFEVFSNEKIPTNDGGISVGQLAIAAKRRRETVLRK